MDFAEVVIARYVDRLMGGIWGGLNCRVFVGKSSGDILVRTGALSIPTDGGKISDPVLFS